MQTIFFIGPTLLGKLPKPLKGEKWFGPAKQGDILSAFLRYNPDQIVLIDGVFRQDLAPWVKEFIYVMACGCRFIGAASMGALRAAELSKYGAVGVGEIYEKYRSGFADESWVACEFHPTTYKISRQPPCGLDRKDRDALEAINFARCQRTKFVPTLDKDALAPYLAPVLEKILQETLLLRGLTATVKTKQNQTK